MERQGPRAAPGLLLTLMLTAVAAGDVRVRTVQTERELLGAFQDPAVSLAVMANDIKLGEAWTSLVEPVLLSHNFSVAAADTAPYAELDFAFFTNKVIVEEGCVLTFTNIMFRRSMWSYPSVGLDLIGRSRGLVVMSNSVHHTITCIENPEVGSIELATWIEPPPPPGKRVYTFLPGGWCRGATSSRPDRCWDLVAQTIDGKTGIYTSDETRTSDSPPTYYLLYINHMFACDMGVSMECIKAKGFKICSEELRMQKLRAEREAAKAAMGAAAAGHSVTTMAIAVALAAVAVAGGLHYRSQQQVQRAQQQLRQQEQEQQQQQQEQQQEGDPPLLLSPTDAKGSASSLARMSRSAPGGEQQCQSSTARGADDEGTAAAMGLCTTGGPGTGSTTQLQSSPSIHTAPPSNSQPQQQQQQQQQPQQQQSPQLPDHNRQISSSTSTESAAQQARDPIALQMQYIRQMASELAASGPNLSANAIMSTGNDSQTGSDVGLLPATRSSHAEKRAAAAAAPMTATLGVGSERMLVLGKQIGRGAYGAVYSGTWKGLQVAVKTMIFNAEDKVYTPGEGSRSASSSASALVRHASGPLSVAVADAAAAAATELGQPLRQGHASSGTDDTAQKQDDEGNKQQRQQQPTSRRDMALREAAVAVSCDHPNVVATYYFDIKTVQSVGMYGSLGGNIIIDDRQTALGEMKLYLVQELCGLNLAEAIARGLLHDKTTKAPKMSRLLPLLLDVAKGMEYLHSRGVLHGDLKPQNVLLKACPDRPPLHVTAKLTDFGLSRVMEPLQTHVSGHAMGTAFYVAPEVARGGQLSKHADVFSWGVMAWQAFTGIVPYMSTAEGGWSQNPEFTGSFRTTPFSQFSNLALSSLQQNPKARPSFAAIAAELEALLQHRAAAAASAMAVTGAGAADVGMASPLEQTGMAR